MNMTEPDSSFRLRAHWAKITQWRERDIKEGGESNFLMIEW